MHASLMHACKYACPQAWKHSDLRGAALSSSASMWASGAQAGREPDTAWALRPDPPGQLEDGCGLLSAGLLL